MIDLHSELADRQRQLAPVYRALGQCMACGTFRVDGKPPTVHKRGCNRGPDGEKVGVLRTGTYHLTATHAPARNRDDIPDKWRQAQGVRDREQRRHTRRGK